MSKNQQYAEKYAAEAMEQMKRYGIPASVTLAQGILESSNGQSELSQLGNNHFGVKASGSWLKNGGDYLVYTDDKPNEKFCKYATVGDSYEHHSKILKNSSRYSQCFKLSPDDYKGWTKGIERGGYATNGGYAASLQKIIEANGLQKYDQQVMKEMRTEGKKFGVEQNARSSTSASVSSEDTKSVGRASISSPDKQIASQKGNGQYSFPVKRDDFLFITSPFGMRQDPMDKSKQQMHKGIDIRARKDDVLATENGGKVVAVNHSTNTGGGKSVTVEYARTDGSKVQTTYMHLSCISVKAGDEVKAGQKLGVSGNTGTRTTGEHLHFGVKNISADGKVRDVDPASYLADIAQKGNLKQQALYNGHDLLAKYRDNSSGVDTSLSPDDWMKKLLSSEDASTGLSNADPIMRMVTTMYGSLLALAVQIDNKSEEEQKAQISEAVSKRQVDLKPLLPTMKECVLSVGENGKAVLQADNGTTKVARELTNAEFSRLSQVLGDTNLSNEAKKMRIAGMVSTIVLTQQASQNYEQVMEQQEGQSQSIQRK
ncbi:glucosaminidase domain-containing protein [uncultured Prevotella sp.]|uniref:glucosaminidase domain-containing protein n=1 Tax=uncultured Prevotella sp. TaxID=159272 RepID=UPI00261D8CD4|nr:glucosaminidase domain-containing protein [uncultured Prevotella sp.]